MSAMHGKSQRRLCEAKVSVDWADSELVLELPLSKRHKHHKVADKFQYRSPPPDGKRAMLILETVDNSDQGWFTLRLLYRACPIKLGVPSKRDEGFTFRVSKQPILSTYYGIPEKLDPDDRCIERLTPDRLGYFLRGTRECTIRLGGRPLHIHGLIRFGKWYRAGTLYSQALQCEMQ
jgi:hypothetical protein